MSKERIALFLVLFFSLFFFLGCPGGEKDASIDASTDVIVQEAIEEIFGQTESKNGEDTTDATSDESEVVSTEDVSPDVAKGGENTENTENEPEPKPGVETVLGCTDPEMQNYNANATCDDGSCVPYALGCTDKTAKNYDSAATKDDGSCIECIYGCTDKTAQNYKPNATCDDGSCKAHVLGCTDKTATNYNSKATKDDGSCKYCVYGCTDPKATNYSPIATCSNNSCTYPVPVAPSGSGGGGGGNSNPPAPDSAPDPPAPEPDPPDPDPEPEVCTCQDPLANNCDMSGDCVDNSLCTYDVCTCQDPLANNADMSGDCIDNSLCEYDVCTCMREDASNYDPSGDCSDDTLCEYPPPDNQGFLLFPKSGSTHERIVFFVRNESIVPDNIDNGFSVYSNLDGKVGGPYYQHSACVSNLTIGTHILTASFEGQEDVRVTIEVKEFDTSNWGLDVVLPWPQFGHDPQGTHTGDYAGPDSSDDRWEISINAFELTQVIIGHNVVLVNENDGITCFDLVNGNQLWKFSQAGLTRFSCPTLSEDDWAYTTAVEVATHKVFTFTLNANTGAKISEADDIWSTYNGDQSGKASSTDGIYTAPPLLLENGNTILRYWDTGLNVSGVPRKNGLRQWSHNNHRIAEWAVYPYGPGSEIGMPTTNEAESYIYHAGRDRMCAGPKAMLYRRSSNPVVHDTDSIYFPGWKVYQGPMCFSSGVVVSSDKKLIRMDNDFTEIWRQDIPVHRFLVDKDNNRIWVVEGGTGEGLTKRSLSDGSKVAGFSNPDFDDCFALTMDAIGRIYGVSVSGIVCANADGATIWKISQTISDQGSIALGNGIAVVIAGDKLVCLGN